MTEYKIDDREYLFVELPDNFKKPIWLKDFVNAGIYHNDDKGYQCFIPFKDVAKYTMVKTTDNITEKDAESFVICTDEASHKLFGDGLFKNYTSANPYYLETAKSSFNSLLVSLNLDIQKNYLILRKISDGVKNIAYIKD